MCLELALGSEDSRTDAQDRLWQTLFYATAAVRSATGGASFAWYTTEEPDSGAAATADGPPEWPRPTVADLADALRAIEPVSIDELSLMRALAASVDSARPWQDPDTEDVFLALPELAEPVRRVAEWIAALNAPDWMTAPLADAQWLVDFDEPESDETPSDETPSDEPENVDSPASARPTSADALAEWRTDGHPGGGHWWCTPPWPLRRTTSARPGLGPVELWAVEDTFGWLGATVERAVVPPAARVYEVTDAESWAALCRDYPLELERSMWDWRLSTGWEGRWVTPDWSLVARDIDAVHLTTAAYLSAAQTAIPVSPGLASMIAGWGPDHTYWFADDLETVGESTFWSRWEYGYAWAHS